MNIRQLDEVLERLADAKQRVKEAEQSLSFGGNDHTMRIKREILEDAERDLEFVYNEEV